MIDNMETPAKLASAIIADFREGAESILDACAKIAKAWEWVDEGGPWSEDKFVNFIDRLSAANIGPGSSVFFVNTKKQGGVFKKSPKAGVYYQMKSVGECEYFKSKEFRTNNRVSSYSVLYRLSVLYEKIIKSPSGSEKQRLERAEKAVFDLITKYGASLTRDEVNEAIKKIGSRQSRAPKQQDKISQSVNVDTRTSTLDELLEGENQYDLVLISPNEEALVDSAGSSISTLMDRAPYQQIMTEKSKAVLIGAGKHLDGLRNLARVTGELDKIYCVRRSKDNSQVLDLSNELLVFTNSKLDLSSGPKTGEKAEEFVQRILGEKAAKGRKLHLFAKGAAEGWDTVDPESSFTEG